MDETSAARGRKAGLAGLLGERRHWATAGLLVLALALLLPGVISLWRVEPEIIASAGRSQPGHDSGESALAAQGPSDSAAYATLEPGLFDAPERAEGWATSENLSGDELEGDSGTLNCIIEPSEVVEIRSPVEGRIDAIHVERSDSIERGQVLVSLDTSVELAAVEVADARAAMTGSVQSREASLRLMATRRRRARELFEANAVSLDAREELETETQVAKLEVQEARENKHLAELEHRQAMAILSRRTINSPISGIVIERLMSEGEVADEDTILRLAQVDPLKVEVVLPAARFGTVKKGMKAAVSPEFPGDQVHVAAVTIVDRVIDGASGTFGVQLELPNPDYAIPGGLHCQVRFLSE